MIKLGSDRDAATHYFQNIALHPSSEKSKNSFHKLSNKPSSHELLNSVTTCPPQHESVLPLNKLASTWVAAFAAGYNVIAHGYGSKTSLIDNFVEQHCSDYHAFTLRPYMKEASLASLLEFIFHTFSKQHKPCRNVLTYANELMGLITSLDISVLLVIHHIDAPSLRTETIQETLAFFSDHPQIRILASVENVNASAMWTPSMNAAFRFIWQECHTFAPYQHELLGLLEGSTRTTINGRATFESCKLVLQALPQNGKQSFRILAEHQLQKVQQPKADAMEIDGSDNEEDMYDGADDDEAGEIAKVGLPYHEWLLRCQQQLIVSSESAFQTQISEFVDHQLVIGAENPCMAGQIYCLPFSTKELKQIVNMLSS